MASQMKFLVALALVAVLALAAVQAQDYDDESGGNQGGDGFGGFSGSSGDDDYAAPRERGVVGAEGSDMNPGYHPQNEEAGNDNYDSEDAAASQPQPTISRANLVKMIKRSN